MNTLSDTIKIITIFPVVAVLILVCSFFIGRIQRAIKNWKLGKQLCPHGVAGGKTRLKCGICKQIESANQEKLEVEKRRLEERKKIAVKANQFRSEELTQLAKLRTHDINFLLSLTPEEFEGIVAEMYRQFDHLVERTPMTNDFGRDIILRKEGKIKFVECKRYALNNLIGRPVLQQFYGTMVSENVDGGIFITTSDFTDTARTFAKEKNMELINGTDLVLLMVRAFPRQHNANEYRVMCRECGCLVLFDLRDTLQETTCRNSHIVKNDYSLDSLVKFISETPHCKKCGAKMQLRSGPRGKFWGAITTLNAGTQSDISIAQLSA
jgi:restriction system protein